MKERTGMTTIIGKTPEKFDEFYKYVIEHCQYHGLPFARNKNFKEWIYSKRQLCIDSKSLFFDWSMWVYCYGLYCKVRRDYDHLSIFLGKAGRGKSTLLMQMCAVINPNFCMKYICYNFDDFVKVLPDKSKFDTFALDEGALILNSLDMDKATKSMDKLSAIMRQFNLYFGICLIDFMQLRRHFREQRVDDLIIISERGQYRIIYGGGIQKVKEQIKAKFGNIENIDVQDDEESEGVFFDALPILNDITPETYLAHKRASAAAFVADMGNDKKAGDSDPEALDTKIMNEKMLTIPELMEKFKWSRATVRKLIQDKKVKAARYNRSWRITADSVFEYMRSMGSEI